MGYGKTLEELCEQYSIWIIEYYSASFNESLFLVWYTDIDEDNTDRLLTYKNGNIFAVKSISKLYNAIFTVQEQLVEFENMNLWLFNLKNIEPQASCLYDLPAIFNEINNNNLKKDTIEDIVNFVNLFNDFAYQDLSNESLKKYASKYWLKKIYNYYYDYIFWKRKNENDFEMFNHSKFAMDHEKLSFELNKMMTVFDFNIKIF